MFEVLFYLEALSEGNSKTKMKKDSSIKDEEIYLDDKIQRYSRENCKVDIYNLIRKQQMLIFKGLEESRKKVDFNYHYVYIDNMITQIEVSMEALAISLITHPEHPNLDMLRKHKPIYPFKKTLGMGAKMSKSLEIGSEIVKIFQWLECQKKLYNIKITGGSKIAFPFFENLNQILYNSPISINTKECYIMNQRLALKKKALKERVVELKKVQNALWRDSTKLFRPLDLGEDCSYENAILNIINSFGMCPLCFSSLNEGIKEYKGGNKTLKEEGYKYQITACTSCLKKIRRSSHSDILDYLEDAKGLFLQQYDETIKNLEKEILTLDRLLGGY